MKYLSILAISIILSSCHINDAHTDDVLIGTWSGLVKTETVINVSSFEDGYKLVFYQPDETFEMNVSDILDVDMMLPEGFYFGYNVSGKFSHPTPTTLYFNSVDTVGNPVRLSFYKTW